MGMVIDGTAGATFPDATTQASAGITASDSATLTNKTIAFSNNTLTDVASTNTSQTLTNKTIAFSNNTLTDVASINTSQTLTSKTLTNPTINAYVEGVVALGTVTTSATIAISAGTVITATLTASTGCTFTMPTVSAGKSFILLLKQAAATGNGTATFTSVKWGTSGAPTITATAGKMDILSFISDGTNWYGSIVQGYTP